MTLIISNTYAIMKCPPDTLEAHTVAVDARSKPGMTQLEEPGMTGNGYARLRLN